MLKIAFITVAWLLVQGTDCFAQLEEATTPAEQQVESGERDLVDSIEDAFRQLNHRNAIDFSHPDQEAAIGIALQRNYVDKRFNDAIREVMANASRPDRWDLAKLAKAERLIPLSTLDESESAQMCFRCYMLADDSKSNRLQQSLKRRLRGFPDETSRLVLDRLREGDHSHHVYALLSIIGSSSEEMLPVLMKAAESDERETALRAHLQLPTLIDRVVDFKNAERKRAEIATIDPDTIDPKFVRYAERVIARYDLNKDSRLSSDEYEKMLMSPKEADANKDGIISVSEYAAWMRNRSTRQ